MSRIGFIPPTAVTPFSESSRYKDTKIILRRPENRRELGLWVSDSSLGNRTSMTLHQITDFDIGRLDMVSYLYYGTPDYWWVLADANDYINPLLDMRVGEYLAVPNRAVIESFVRRLPSKS